MQPGISILPSHSVKWWVKKSLKLGETARSVSAGVSVCNHMCEGLGEKEPRLSEISVYMVDKERARKRNWGGKGALTIYKGQAANQNLVLLSHALRWICSVGEVTIKNWHACYLAESQLGLEEKRIKVRYGRQRMACRFQARFTC